MQLPVLVAVWVIGAAIFYAAPGMSVVFLPLAYLVLLQAVFASGRGWKDWINPLVLLVLVGVVRFSLPGLLLWAGADPDVAVFQRMRLDTTDWFLGHVMALLGLLGVAIGWWLPSRKLRLTLEKMVRPLWRQSSPHLPLAAIGGIAVGLAALLTFVAGNVSVGDVVTSGAFRGTEIQVGTGKFFYLSLTLIAGSVLFSAYLFARGRAPLVALAPVVLPMLAFWPLGGRARAVTPLGAGLLLLWYQTGGLKRVPRGMVILALALLPVILYAGQAYRGGLGLEGLMREFSLRAVLDYIQGAVWVDWGQLHALAGAAAIGPGVLGGASFQVLLWPLSEVLGLGAKNAGVLIAEMLVGLEGGVKWGFHASMIGDAYLNLGLPGVLVVTVCVGVVLRAVYAGWRRGAVHPALYALATVYGLRVFYESIEKYAEAVTVIAFAVLMLWLDRSLRRMGQRMRRRQSAS